MAVQEGLVADDEDDDCETALEDAITGLDLLLRSLARDKGPRSPPVAKSTPDNPPPLDLSEADSIDAMPLKPTVGSAPHNNTVTPTPKDVARNIRLKQATLSFGKSSATTDGDNNRAGPSNLEKPRWKLNLAQLIDDVYEDAYEKWLATWSSRFPWLVLTKTVAGLPAFKCSVCAAHAGDAGKCGRRGKGATDVQTQAFRKHAGTQKHKLAMAKYTSLVDGGSRQPRIDQHRAACDEDKLRVVALLDSLLFVSKCDAPMGLWVKLVRYLAEKGVKGFPKKGYGTYYTTGLAAVSYGLASMAMVFLNKGVLTYYKFSMTLLALQMIATTALIYVCGKLEWITMRPFSLSTARRLLPLSFFYNANVAFALASLQGVNIPMYIALKRLTPMAVLITGFFTGKAKQPLQVTLSVSLTTFGCLIAALGDFSLDPYAYALALTSVLCQTFYLLLVERSGAEQGISSFELMFYNSLLSLPFLGAILLCTNELPTSVPLLFTMCADSSTFTVAVTASLVMALVLNYTMFLCTIVNSALTTTIVGVLKGVFTTVRTLHVEIVSFPSPCHPTVSPHSHGP
ncbi:unnamed protein product [Closterium sp. Naga37s-1]|nr:unnamed protein product [Closterium sp. Naga37s-1]